MTVPAVPDFVRRIDVRLFLPALGCWVMLLSLRSASAATAASVGVVGVFVAAGLILVRRRVGLVAAGAALAMAAGAGVMAVRAAARGSGPLAGLADRGVVAEMVVQLASDPLARSGFDVATGRSYGYVFATAQLVELDQGGRRWGMRQPVLLLARDKSWVGLLPSQRLRVAGRLTPPRRGDSVTAVVDVRGRPDIVGQPSPIQRAAGGLRAGLRAAAAPLPGDSSALLPGLVDGDTAALPEAVVADFRRTGLTHLVAVSGTNVAIVGAAVTGLARRTRAGPRATALLAALAVVGFVVLARPTGSVVRAAVMGLLGLAGIATARPRPALAGLCTAVLVLLLVEPALAAQPGFALSVLATLGLLVLGPGWTRWLARWLPEPLAAAVAIPAAAQVACAPVIALIGGGLSLAAIPANLVAAPAVAPATIFGVCAAALGPLLPFLAGLCAWGAAVPCLFLLGIAHLAARVPFASVPWPDGWQGAVLMVGVALVFAVFGKAAVRFSATHFRHVDRIGYRSQ